MKKTLLSTVLLGLVLALALSGCSRQRVPADLPKLYPATVSITQDGKPLEGATIIFFGSDPASLKWGVAGCTDASGKAVMATNGMYKGAPVGNYQVTVTKNESTQQEKAPPSPDPEKDPVAFNEWRLKYVDSPIKNKEFSLIEVKYTLLESTPFKAEVSQAGPNDFKFDVGKAVRVEMKYDH